MNNYIIGKETNEFAFCDASEKDDRGMRPVSQADVNSACPSHTTQSHRRNPVHHPITQSGGNWSTNQADPTKQLQVGPNTRRPTQCQMVAVEADGVRIQTWSAVQS
ncbi:hypothetical protein J6590_007535 [Homalodisca vitripennis]|nr:hypothetical protein J6590_007535 [Homalodisca vitripennis]